jgi:hypothetical protein
VEKKGMKRIHDEEESSVSAEQKVQDSQNFLLLLLWFETCFTTRTIEEKNHELREMK